MNILKISLRYRSVVRDTSSSDLILLATLGIGISRGHRISRLLGRSRLLYGYLFPFLVKHCHLAQDSKKRTHSLTCVFLSLIYKVPKRSRHITKPLGTTWSSLSGRCPMRPWFRFFGAKHLLYIK